MCSILSFCCCALNKCWRSPFSSSLFISLNKCKSRVANNTNLLININLLCVYLRGCGRHTQTHNFGLTNNNSIYTTTATTSSSSCSHLFAFYCSRAIFLFLTREHNGNYYIKLKLITCAMRRRSKWIAMQNIKRRTNGQFNCQQITCTMYSVCVWAYVLTVQKTKRKQTQVHINEWNDNMEHTLTLAVGESRCDIEWSLGTYTRWRSKTQRLSSSKLNRKFVENWICWTELCSME